MKDCRMTYDPNPAYGQEKRRSGPRWYSVVAFLVIAFLLAVNALAVFANVEANEEQACQTKMQTAFTNTNFAKTSASDFRDFVKNLEAWCDIDD